MAAEIIPSAMTADVDWFKKVGFLTVIPFLFSDAEYLKYIQAYSVVYSNTWGHNPYQL
jgi:hypothetical protein